MGLISDLYMRSLMFSLVSLLDISDLIERSRGKFFSSDMRSPGKATVKG